MDILSKLRRGINMEDEQLKAELGGSLAGTAILAPGSQISLLLSTRVKNLLQSLKLIWKYSWSYPQRSRGPSWR